MRKITICALLMVGCAQESHTAPAGCRALEGAELWHIQAQVAAKEEASLPQYFFGKPQDSIRSLSELVETYRQAQCTSVVPQEARAAFQYNELLAVGRLARLHKALGDEASSSAETNRAVNLGRTALRNPSWSAGDLAKLIDDVDAKQRAYVKEAQQGQGAKR